MADNYQNIKGTLRPSFRFSPSGVEISSRALSGENLQGLFLKRNKTDKSNRVLTESDIDDYYDLELPRRSIATYSQEENFIIFYLNTGETVRIPKSISNLEQAGTVIGPAQSVPHNIVTFADSTGINIADEGHAIVETMQDSANVSYANSTDIPTAGAVWNLVGESKLILYARLMGMLDTQSYDSSSGETLIPPIYDLVFKIQIDGLKPTFTDIELLYNYDNNIEASGYLNAGVISNEDKVFYDFTFKTASSSKPIFFKFRIHDSELGTFLVGNMNNGNFVVFPNGEDSKGVDVKFSYPESAVENIIGEAESYFIGNTEYTFSNSNKTISRKYIYKNTLRTEVTTIPIENIRLEHDELDNLKLHVYSSNIEDKKYLLKITIDNSQEITYSMLGGEVILASEDAETIEEADVVEVTPVIWGYSLAKFRVKG